MRPQVGVTPQLHHPRPSEPGRDRALDIRLLSA
jgi:hypothetical protein